LHLTTTGGHCGYLGVSPNGKVIRWMDHVILNWIKNLK
jgi:predicted alpha/beta-fold hydrolase